MIPTCSNAVDEEENEEDVEDDILLATSSSADTDNVLFFVLTTMSLPTDEDGSNKEEGHDHGDAGRMRILTRRPNIRGLFKTLLVR